MYSGEGINLVQFVIEEQKKKTLDVLMQEAIFGPLGMTRTGIIYRKEFERECSGPVRLEREVPVEDEAISGASGGIDDHERGGFIAICGGVVGGKDCEEVDEEEDAEAGDPDTVTARICVGGE